MTSMYVGWLLVASSIALSALAIRHLQSGSSQRRQFNLEAYMARFSQMPSSGPAQSRGAPGTGVVVLAAAIAFVLVAGIGAVTSYNRADESPASGAAAHASADGAILAGLEDYAAKLEPGDAKPATSGDDLLPDVNTMIERLAARLKANPADVNGWRMLGWSYFNMQRYDDAAAAYAKAMELDPSSAELKRAHEEAKAKASGDDTPAALSAPQTGVGVEHSAASQGAPHEVNAAIRAMVDGLATRLESSPRDVDGWTRLMRSRVVLGEKGIAEEACRKALDVFKDDAAALGQIKAAAAELGLRVE
ncbi:MAG: tetratricopeptide repeat protein [Hyphomicrobium sp.]|uniref:tetratricopeptide repeat protein n=1 Tax=Hyphomicrobium sp. TaxID=82 RepID=UPI003D119FC3